VLKSVFGSVVLAVLVSPAFAKEFWVQYDYSTHECSIVEKKSPENGTGTSQDATAANTEPNGATSNAPNTATTPTMLPASSAPANTTVITPSDQPGSAASPTPATASGTPPATPDTSTAANPDDKKNDPYAATTAAWAKKKAEAEAAGTADVQTVLIGTAMHTREEAESEMQIMRRCGIAN
jgi:hypothetical protein